MHTPTIICIVGVTGDLARRKLLPALGALAAAGFLPKPFRIVGITRQTGITVDDLLEGIENEEHLQEHVELFSMSLTSAADYARLSTRLNELDRTLGESAERLWYLAVPPTTSWAIIEQLGHCGLSHVPHTKLLLDKPFGIDKKSAEELATHIAQSFLPDQVYRIDHYLAKEAVQHIISLKQTSQLLWSRDTIERLDIVASETIGIEGRALFYEQTGALRDFTQSHLLQLAAITLMSLPEGAEEGIIPLARCALLKTLEVSSPVRRGQYVGYREQVHNPSSMVETFASLTLTSTDEIWRDVPITLTTGKALNTKKTEIRLTYRPTGASAEKPLTFTITPDGGYERIFQDALQGDHSIFVSNAEVLESWRIIDAARKSWEHETNLTLYPRGATADQVLQEGSAHSRHE